MSSDSVVGKLKAKIGYHEAEVKRLRALVDAIVKEVGDDAAATGNPARFKGLRFPAAIALLLRETGPMSAAQVTDALLAGGFETDSDQPRRNIASLLDQQEKRGVVRRSGDRTSGVLWSLGDR